jgi:hypothetical protein
MQKLAQRVSIGFTVVHEDSPDKSTVVENVSTNKSQKD